MAPNGLHYFIKLLYIFLNLQMFIIKKSCIAKLNVLINLFIN